MGRIDPTLPFTNRDDNAFHPLLYAGDLPTGIEKHPFHLLGPVFGADKDKTITSCHPVQTCPHIFKAGSTVTAIIQHIISFNHLALTNQVQTGSPEADARMICPFPWHRSYLITLFNRTPEG